MLVLINVEGMMGGPGNDMRVERCVEKLSTFASNFTQHCFKEIIRHIKNKIPHVHKKSHI